MKDLIKHLSCLLIVLLASMALPSCGDDDDEPTNEVTEKTMAEMLEGTWQWNSSYYYTFYKDGTGEWFSKSSDGTYGWRNFFNWTYDPKTQILALKFEDEDDNDDFLIVSISEHYLNVKWRDSDGSWFDEGKVLPRVE
jgi:hypothetical protein